MTVLMLPIEVKTAIATCRPQMAFIERRFSQPERDSAYFLVKMDTNEQINLHVWHGDNFVAPLFGFVLCVAQSVYIIEYNRGFVGTNVFVSTLQNDRWYSLTTDVIDHVPIVTHCKLIDSYKENNDGSVTALIELRGRLVRIDANSENCTLRSLGDAFCGMMGCPYAYDSDSDLYYAWKSPTRIVRTDINGNEIGTIDIGFNDVTRIDQMIIADGMLYTVHSSGVKQTITIRDLTTFSIIHQMHQYNLPTIAVISRKVYAISEYTVTRTLYGIVDGGTVIPINFPV